MKDHAATLSSQASVHLHIERLVLDGVPLASAEIPRFQGSLEYELGRLLASGSVEGWSGCAISCLDCKPVRLAAGSSPQAWGRETARTLFASINTQIANGTDSRGDAR
jgi:hypothetical protein